jgi:galactoside O-acetyltransferase
MGRIRELASLPRALYEMCVIYLPGPLGVSLRSRFYSRRVKSMGSNVVFDVGVQLVNPEYMTFGDNILIDKYVVLTAGPSESGGRVVGHKANAYFRHAEGELVIGDYVHIAQHVVINGHGGVEIGRYSGVSSGSRIYSLSHHHRNPNDRSDQKLYRFSPLVPLEDQALISGPVVVCENAGIATNVVVLPGATVREDAWVGVGSVVMGEVAPGLVVSGNPAAPISARPGYERDGERR